MIAKDTQYRHSISNSGSIHQPIGNRSQTSVQELEEDVCPPKEFMGDRQRLSRFGRIMVHQDEFTAVRCTGIVV